jgi:predicted metalloprotease with PDZ domain
MRTRFVLPLLLILFLGIGCAEDSVQTAAKVSYSVSFPELAQHRARITARFEGVPTGQVLEVRMARTSPGRYALHEFARHVVDLEVHDGAGNPLSVIRPDPHQWNVSGHDGVVEVAYSVFGDRADGTFNGFDRTFAHMNGPATWLWARGQGDAPIDVTFNLPDSTWEVATQLVPGDEANRFSAPDLYYLMDSPVRLADMDWFSVEREGQQLRIALQHEGTPEQAAAWAENVWKIVDAQTAVFGELPRYDFGTYSFLTAYLPHVFGDGMEHRNSTVVTGTSPLNGEGTANLGTMAHEYFHQWNVERIRPVSLEPFDFEDANLSDLLWLAEGFTSYYTPLSIRRAGITSDSAFAAAATGMVNAVVNAPGRRHRSAAEMSEWATFSDRGVFGDRMDTGNTFLSYYTWGSAIGLALDLELRTRFDTSLDAFMRLMWERFGRSETPYTLADAQAALAEVSGDAAFASSFFGRFVRGREAADYAGLLTQAGMTVRPVRDGRVHRAIRVETDDSGVRLSTAPPEGTAWYAAGWDVGDRIERINGRPVASDEAFDALMDRAAPGDVWTVEGSSRGVELVTEVALEADPALEVVLMEHADMAPSYRQLAIRQAWLDGYHRP